MARYLSFRDGGKTDEKGISQHLSGLFTGEVINGLAVAQNSPLAMIVTVSKGRCMIDSGSDYPYLGFTDGTESVNVNTADGSNPRIDTLVAYVDKAVVDSTTSNNPNAFKFKAVAGTPAGSPVAPNSAAISSSIGAGNPYIKLANIAVGAGVTTISNGNITDTRIDTSAVLADDVVTTAKIADSVVTPEKLITGTGTSWAWQSWTPTLTGASTNPTLGTNSVAEGRYTQIGKTVICQIDIKFGTSGTNAGSGTYYISLPVAAKTAISGYQVMPIGFLRALDASAGYGAVFFPEVETSTTAQLVYYQGIGGTGPASGVAHNNPWAWSTSDIVCAGTITYEAA